MLCFSGLPRVYYCMIIIQRFFPQISVTIWMRRFLISSSECNRLVYTIELSSNSMEDNSKLTLYSFYSPSLSAYYPSFSYHDYGSLSQLS